MICLDTSVLIDFYRKKNKTNSFFYKLSQYSNSFAVSVITEYEILVGSNAIQDIFWIDLFKSFIILPYNSLANQHTLKIFRYLKAINKIIDIPDLFIAGTSIANQLPLATLNNKHFERIPNINLLDKSTVF